MIFIFKLFFFLIVFLFISGITLFLYKGATIYELITQSNSYDIFEKTNIDIESRLNKNTTFNFALTNDYIYDITTNIKSNCLLKQLYFVHNSDNPVLSIENEQAKIVALLAKAKLSFVFENLIL